MSIKRKKKNRQRNRKRILWVIGSLECFCQACKCRPHTLQSCTENRSMGTALVCIAPKRSPPLQASITSAHNVPGLSQTPSPPACLQIPPHNQYKCRRPRIPMSRLESAGPHPKWRNSFSLQFKSAFKGPATNFPNYLNVGSFKIFSRFSFPFLFVLFC